MCVFIYVNFFFSSFSFLFLCYLTMSIKGNLTESQTLFTKQIQQMKMKRKKMVWKKHNSENEEYKQQRQKKKRQRRISRSSHKAHFRWTNFRRAYDSDRDRMNIRTGRPCGCYVCRIIFFLFLWCDFKFNDWPNTYIQRMHMNIYIHRISKHQIRKKKIKIPKLQEKTY